MTSVQQTWSVLHPGLILQACKQLAYMWAAHPQTGPQVRFISSGLHWGAMLNSMDFGGQRLIKSCPGITQRGTCELVWLFPSTPYTAGATCLSLR